MSSKTVTIVMLDAEPAQLDLIRRIGREVAPDLSIRVIGHSLVGACALSLWTRDMFRRINVEPPQITLPELTIDLKVPPEESFEQDVPWWKKFHRRHVRPVRRTYDHRSLRHERFPASKGRF